VSQDHPIIALPLDAGESVSVIEVDGRYYVPMAPIVERLGLAWPWQREKLLRDGWRYGTRMFRVVCAGGRVLEQPCVPILRLPVYTWLLSPVSRERADRAWLRRLDVEWEAAVWAFFEARGAVIPAGRFIFGGYQERLAAISSELAQTEARTLERIAAAETRARASEQRLASPIECARSLVAFRRERPVRAERATPFYPIDADWMIALRNECDRTSQGQVSRRLGVSVAMINQTLKGTYQGRVDRIETLVRAKLMTAGGSTDGP
jgi:hypothetical protein